ncbi:MAG: DNA polymerase III subunit alpha [Thermoanaerobaculia bacterium]|nr:MAG: DNA polymerase III subunit alpha [Thermoanaerobaculia bacterium]MBZ0103149.1 DNA polymerase III subunit alpha [Thermoanaerobaculia bacterium]
MSFVHLHLHSQYSLLDGANRLDEVIGAAKAAGQPALALTDHGNLFGAIEFYDRARKAGVKPILGIEAYVAQGSHTERSPQRSSSNHLVLLARNETGWRNLIKLTTRSYLDGFYYKPRIDHELLRRHAEGLIGLSACLKGEINEQILSRREAEAEQTARSYREILGEGNFYLELQDHGIPEQRAANEVLRRLARKLELPLVATNDCHYLRKEDAFAHEVLLCVGTQTTLADPDRLKYASDEFYLKNIDEMRKLFPQDLAALENTMAIAERCNVELAGDGFHLPEFPVPAGETVDSHFERIAREGFEERLAELRRRSPAVFERHSEDAYRERLRYEIDVIRRMGFAGYFLIVWDFIRHARECSIPVGPGRGSAAGSLVSWAMRITDIDPLQYDLLFERFLNPERVSMPDIDTDICQRRRGEVLQYVADKYGRDRVSQIITFGTLAAKGVLRDVGRVMGLPYAEVDRVAKMLPDMEKSLGEAAKTVDSLAAEIRNDPKIREVVEIGSRLEGLTRHASVHAAGVVITPVPTDEIVPLYKTSKDEIVTQWDMKGVERLGLLKMDFLGLKTVTVVDDTLRMLRHLGTELDLDAVPLDDPATFEIFAEGRTSGIFQFESSGMRDMLRRARPSRFEDLAAFNALYRPGALSVGMVDTFIARKSGAKKVIYILPETEPILRETYGVIAYQEQVMQIAVAIAGFTMGEADVLRKAMGKKKLEVMAEQKSKFLDGAERKGFARAKAEELWNYIEPFAGYGFNKSHSVAYAMLAYKTAYLKAHFPAAFMAAMLTSEIASTDDVVKYVGECRELGIPVLPPDLNVSEWAFAVEGSSIRFGLGGIKGLGESAAEAILAARRRVGRFRSLAQLAAEVDSRNVNLKVLETLVKSGACDGFGFHRAALAASLERTLDWAQRRRRAEEAGQGSLFGGGMAAELEPPVEETIPVWPEADRLRAEKEALGFFLTGNPLAEFEARLAALTTHTTRALREGYQGEATIGGLVTRVKRLKIKSGANAGKVMARFVLEDLAGGVNATAFAEALKKYDSLLVEDAAVVVRGAVRERGSEVEISVEEITPLDRAARRLITGVRVELKRELSRREMLELRELLAGHPGDAPVTLATRLPSGVDVEIAAEARFRVEYSSELVGAVESLVGRGSVHRLGL